MKNVLIPTDFSLASLELVERTAQTLEGQPLTITLFHAFEIPFYVSDLVGNGRKLPYAELVTDAFRNACKRLKEQYPKTIRSIVIRHQYGNTPAVFRNFADANDIDLVVYPDHYVFHKVHADSVNPGPLFAKSGVPLLKTFTVNHKPVNGSKEIAHHLITIKEEVYAVKKEHSLSLHSRED